MSFEIYFSQVTSIFVFRLEDFYQVTVEAKLTKKSKLTSICSVQ